MQDVMKQLQHPSLGCSVLLVSLINSSEAAKSLLSQMPPCLAFNLLVFADLQSLTGHKSY